MKKIYYIGAGEVAQLVKCLSCSPKAELEPHNLSENESLGIVSWTCAEDPNLFGES